MALNRITADSIADGTIIDADVADGTITAAKLASGVLPSATANSAASYANSAFASANSAATYANSAFNQANTDVTGISITSGVYGNATAIPSLTLEANGRVSAVTTSPLVTDPLPNILMLSGM
jgi:hypothetical protein